MSQPTAFAGEVTLEARLEQLREASHALGVSAFRIRTAVETVNGIVDALYARGFESDAADLFHETYRRQRTIMDEWPDDLDGFATELTAAADAIEQAIVHDHPSEGVGDPDNPTDDGQQGGNMPLPIPGGGTLPSNHGSSGTGNSGGNSSAGTGGSTGGTGGSSSSSSSGHGSSGNSGRGRSSGGSSGGTTGRSPGATELYDPTLGDARPELEAPPEAPPIDGYLNQHNQGLMQSLTDTQNSLTEQQTTLTQLQTQRAAVQQELNDLLARMGSAGATPNARIRGLQEQLNALDQNILGTQNQITGLEAQASSIQQRLETVRPGPGADLELIASLEGGHTSEAILRATRQADNSVNCVNFVCSRMNIPPGIPNNALLWPENAANHPEYGITIGDKPLQGSVIVMQPAHSYGDDRFGHVMYVERIDPDGSAWVTDNNHHTPVRLQDITTELTGPNISYMYFPWETSA